MAKQLNHEKRNRRALCAERGTREAKEREDAASKWLAKQYREDRKRPFSEADDRTEQVRRAETWKELVWLGQQSGRKMPGWALATFKELFGVWPEWWMKELQPREASAELQKWVRARGRAWLKAEKAKGGFLNDMEAQAAVKKKIRGKNGHDGGALSSRAAKTARRRRAARRNGKVEGGLDEQAVEGVGRSMRNGFSD